MACVMASSSARRLAAPVGGSVRGSGEQDVAQQPQAVQRPTLDVPALVHPDAEDDVGEQHGGHRAQQEQVRADPGAVDEYQPGDERDDDEVTERVGHADRAFELRQRAVAEVRVEQVDPAEHQAGDAQDAGVDQRGTVAPTAAPPEHPDPDGVHRIGREVERVGRGGERLDPVGRVPDPQRVAGDRGQRADQQRDPGPAAGQRASQDGDAQQGGGGERHGEIGVIDQRCGHQGMGRCQDGTDQQDHEPASAWHGVSFRRGRAVTLPSAGGYPFLSDARVPARRVSGRVSAGRRGPCGRGPGASRCTGPGRPCRRGRRSPGQQSRSPARPNTSARRGRPPAAAR